ncbi:MAG: purine-nucleoside phosphorylase [Chloroflexi bacterium]|nr:purine-nucleoside phosphorylase [Chloroflexota bacterium]
MNYTRADYEQAAAVIRERLTVPVTVGLVLGSGLGPLADTVTEPLVISYDDLPGWPRSTVLGHAGRLVIGRLGNCGVIAQQGRAHFYEGYTQQQVGFAVRVMHLLGIRTLIVTNAAGGINTAYQVGDLMMLNDHINFVGMAGHNPLIGANNADFGDRFVSMTQTYDRDLRQIAAAVAAQAGITLHEGVYACVAGPNFETPAEIRLLRMVGADTVGMSTAHEVIVARQVGMQVLAVSSITNLAVDQIDSNLETTHREVLDGGAQIVPRMTTLLQGVLEKISC